jgi:hypothetical protein|tara:strand:- start:77 stop:1321 length:1245 start_codon:yes stop_codon:yes gene_type:complete
MSGTGFLDNWKPVDTTKEPSQQEKVETDLPSTAEVVQAPVVTQTLPSVEERQSGMDSGFGNDFPLEALVDDAPLPIEEDAVALATSTSTGNWTLPQSANPAWKRIAAARSTHVRREKKVLCGVVGGRKAGKSGMLIDSLTDEEIANGAMIFIEDFDAGGDSTVSAHHLDKQENIVVLNPWITNKKSKSRVPFNYPETFNKTMDDLLYALEVAESQDEYFKVHGKMPNPYLKTFIFDGMDHWLHICGTAMKIEDLELGDDAVEVSGRKTATKVGRFNWEFRKNRYQAAMNTFQELSRLNVHVYAITGVKPSFDSSGNEIMGAEIAAWMKDTERDLEQLIEVSLDFERNEIGELTGKTISKAQLKFNRTSLRLPEPVILFQQEVGTDGQWFGYKGIRDGSFEHPDDTHELPTEESA